MKRRQVLIGCSAVGLAIGSQPGELLAGLSVQGDDKRGPLTKARFERLLKDSFQLFDSKRRPAERLILEAVDDGLASPRAEQFALVFRGSNRAPLRADTYTLEHAQEGRFQLYLEPSSLGRGGAYRAVFSLLR
jgi:hypothetical protein